MIHVMKYIIIFIAIQLTEIVMLTIILAIK